MATCGVCEKPCDAEDRRELPCGHTLCQDCVVSLLVSLERPVCPLDLKVFEAAPDDLQAREAALQLMSGRPSAHSYPAPPKPRVVPSSGSSSGGLQDVSRCSVCGQRFSEPRLLREHYREHHPEQLPFACELCPDTFSSGQDLQGHRQGHLRAAHERPSTHTASASTKGPITLLFLCSKCLQTFRAKDELFVHLKNHVTASSSPASQGLIQSGVSGNTGSSGSIGSSGNAGSSGCTAANPLNIPAGVRFSTEVLNSTAPGPSQQNTTTTVSKTDKGPNTTRVKLFLCTERLQTFPVTDELMVRLRKLATASSPARGAASQGMSQSGVSGNSGSSRSLEKK